LVDAPRPRSAPSTVTHSEPQHPPVVHVIGTSFATDIALLQTFPQ